MSHPFDQLHCLGLAAEALMTRAQERGESRVLVHLRGMRIEITPNRENNQVSNIVPMGWTREEKP